MKSLNWLRKSLSPSLSPPFPKVLSCSQDLLLFRATYIRPTLTRSTYPTIYFHISQLHPSLIACRFSLSNSSVKDLLLFCLTRLETAGIQKFQSLHIATLKMDPWSHTKSKIPYQSRFDLHSLQSYTALKGEWTRKPGTKNTKVRGRHNFLYSKQFYTVIVFATGIMIGRLKPFKQSGSF